MACNIFGQTGRYLKTRFRKHFRKIKKPKKFDTFLYRHFKNNGHSPSKIIIQPVEKIIYDPNSSSRLKNIKRHETELKWITFLQSLFPLGLMIIYTMKVIFLNARFWWVFFYFECIKRKSWSHGKRKNGNIKPNICTEKRTNTSLHDLSIALNNHGWHGLLSFLSSLPISILRNLELEANKLYDRANKLYKAALLTRCYVQHFLNPYIDSEVSLKRHFIKIPFINKVNMKFIDLHSIFTDNLVTSSIPNYFNNETPIICYKNNKPNRSTVFNFNKIVIDINIDSKSPDSWDCQNSNYLYPLAGHVITGNLNVIPDARVRNISSKGPKYRFPSKIDFPKCRREISASLNDFSNRWCKRENVEPCALKERKNNIFKSIDICISFYALNTHPLPPKPKSSFCHLKWGIQYFHMNYVLVPTDKAANNIVVVWRLHYINTLKRELVDTNAYKLQPSLSERVIVDGHGCHTALHFGVKAKENQDKVPTLYWLT